MRFSHLPGYDMDVNKNRYINVGEAGVSFMLRWNYFNVYKNAFCIGVGGGQHSIDFSVTESSFPIRHDGDLVTYRVMTNYPTAYLFVQYGYTLSRKSRIYVQGRAVYNLIQDEILESRHDTNYAGRFRTSIFLVDWDRENSVTLVPEIGYQFFFIGKNTGNIGLSYRYNLAPIYEAYFAIDDESLLEPYLVSRFRSGGVLTLSFRADISFN